MKPKVAGIIPARYGSTRFPGKPLAVIEGKSMIQRVYEQAKDCDALSDVAVATDDKRIADHITHFGGKVIMTEEHHQSGTDRCAEAIEKLEGDFEVVVNIQGDEPFIEPEQIELLVSCFEDENTQIGTLVKEIEEESTLFNYNVPKVVISKNHEAIYFSRHAIPYIRNKNEEDWLETGHTFYKHIGIYGYRSDILKELTRLEPSSLEKTESLEQLRWLENNYRIKVAVTEIESFAVDTPEDLERLIEQKFSR